MTQELILKRFSMGILFTVVLILAPCTGVYFFILQKNKKELSEAFLNRYTVLVNLLTYKRTAEFTKLRSNFISVTIKMKSDLHFLAMEEFDERLYITWKYKSSDNGKAEKAWSFNPSYSQSLMYGEILTDIRRITEQMRRQRRRSLFERLSAA